MFSILIEVAGNGAVDEDLFMGAGCMHKSGSAMGVFDNNPYMRAVSSVIGTGDSNDVTVLEFSLDTRDFVFWNHVNRHPIEALLLLCHQWSQLWVML